MFFKLLVVGHILGDFFFQPQRLVKGKKEKIGLLLLHTFIYTLLISIVLLVYVKWWIMIILSCTTFGSHFIIDWVKTRKIEVYFEEKKENIESADFWSFIVDQLLHIVILFIVWLIFDGDLNEIGTSIKNSSFLSNYNIPYTKVFNYMLSILIISLPSMLFIKKLLAYIFKGTVKDDNDMKQENSEEKKSDKESNLKQEGNKKENPKVGAIIGILERLLILFLGSMNLYASIPIVLTAKSIARFHQLSDQAFAEKYLLGTLVSLIISILVVLTIM